MSYIPELETIRRAQIIEAALACIARKGYPNVSMEEIAKSANLSKGGLAHYYKSKKALFKAAFQEFFERIFIRGKEEMDRYNHPVEKLLSFVWLYNREDPEAEIGYPILFDFMSLALHDQELKKIFERWVGNWINLLSQALRQGMEEKIFIQFEPESMARTISSIYQGIATRWYMDPEHHSTQWAIDNLKKAVKGLLAPYTMKQQLHSFEHLYSTASTT